MDIFDGPIASSFFRLLGLLEQNVFDDILLGVLHIDLRVVVPVDHAFFIRVLVTGLREMVPQPVLAMEVGGLSNGARVTANFFFLHQLLLSLLDLVLLHICKFNGAGCIYSSGKVIGFKALRVLLHLDLVLTHW